MFQANYALCVARRNTDKLSAIGAPNFWPEGYFMDEKFFMISIVEYDVRNSLTIIGGNQLNSLLNSG